LPLSRVPQLGEYENDFIHENLTPNQHSCVLRQLTQWKWRVENVFAVVRNVHCLKVPSR
jgi:hypothetical protein